MYYSCKSNTISSVQHVGCFLDPSKNVKPVDEWDMSFPTDIQSLVTSMSVDRCPSGLISSTVREASITQYRHLQGEVDAITNLTRLALPWSGFLAVNQLRAIVANLQHIRNAC